MKEKIISKIEEQINLILEKDVLTIDEINFLKGHLFSLEIEENKEESDRKHKETIEALVKLYGNI